MTCTRIHNLLAPGLFPILDVDLALPGTSRAEVIEQFLDADHALLIVRQKKWPKEKIISYLGELHELAGDMDFKIIMHQDFDLLKLFYDQDPSWIAGIHLTSLSEPITNVRKFYGNNILVGYSAHSKDEAIKASQDGADYIFLGAVYPTPKEHEHPFLGTDILSETCAAIDIPVYAIGGIHEGNLAEIADAGAYGFSALRALYADGTIEHNAAKMGFMWEDSSLTIPPT